MKNALMLFIVFIALVCPVSAIDSNEIERLSDLNDSVQVAADRSTVEKFKPSLYEKAVNVIGLDEPAVKNANRDKLKTTFGKGHIAISSEGIQDIQIPYEFISSYVNDGMVQVDHRANGGNIDATWYQKIENVDGYCYLASVPFSTIEIHAYGTAHAYIPNDAGDTVSVVNLTTNTIIDTISVSAEPDVVVVNHAGTRAYVPGYYGTVDVIDTSDNSVITTVSVGGGSLGACISPDDAYLYVSCESCNNVSVISTSTNTVTSSITGFSAPRGITLSPDGTKLYVANYDNGTASIVTLATGARSQVTVGTNPTDVEVSTDGSKLYVSCLSDVVSVINLSTNEVTDTISVGLNPYSLVMSPTADRLYVSARDSNYVNVINTTSNTAVTTVTVGTAPRGISINPIGTKVYVANTGGNSVSVIDTSSNTVSATITGFSGPISLGIIMRPEIVPEAGYTASVTSGNAPLSVSFTDSSTGSPDSYKWNFGDGNTSTSQNPSHTFYTAGTYNVSLNVSNLAGYSIYTDTITVNNAPVAPVAGFKADVTSGDLPLHIQFTDESMNSPTSWYWDLGEGNFSESQNPSCTYYIAGTYTVELTATNGVGSDTEIKTNYITVTSPEAPVSVPNAGFTANITNGSAPLTVTFTDGSTNDPISWAWNFGDGTADSTSQNPIHTFNEVGTYTVTLTASNSAGSDTLVRTEYITVPTYMQNATLTMVGAENVVLDVNAPHSFNFTTDNPLSTVTWYVNGAPLTTTGQELSVSFDEGNEFYNVSAIGMTGNNVTNTLTWWVHTKREMATSVDEIQLYDEQNYNNFRDNFTNFDSTNMTVSAVTPFTDLMGRSFYLILFVMPFILLWQKQQKLTIPATLGLITGCLFIGFVPDQYREFLTYAVILSFAVNLFFIGRERT